MKTFKCIKPSCENSYESDEHEAYYCPSCQEANKALAKQINAQVAARPKRSRVSEVAELERQKAESGVRMGGMIGIKYKI